MEHLAAKIIAYGTLIITVGLCVWLGLKAARRDKQYPQKVEYLEDGFVYHDPFGDNIVRWQDITAVEAKQETHRAAAGKYSYGKTTDYWVLDIFTGKKSFFIFSQDFDTNSFDQFVTALQQKACTSNPQFRGITGDIYKFRETVPLPEAVINAREQIKDEAFERILQSKISALGHPPNSREALRLIEETEREMAGQHDE